MDSIHVSAATCAGLNAISEAYNLGDLQPWILPERVALLIRLLPELPDRDDWFPRGKWATIQHLQGELDKQIAQLIESEAT